MLSLNPIIRLLNSSKALVMAVAIAAVCALAYFKLVPATDAMNFVKWVVAAYMAAVGIEDAGAKSAGKPAPVPEAPPVIVNIPSPVAMKDEEEFSAFTGLVIAVVNRSARVNNTDALTMTDACAYQLRNHVAPLWRIAAPMCKFFPDASKIPASAYVVAIVDQPDVDGALGYHTELSNGSVDAFIFVNPVLDNGGSVMTGPADQVTVSSVLSHELMEMLVDPTASLWADGPQRAEGMSYALEVADPVESDSYSINSHGVQVNVSNFVSPAWFDVVTTRTRFDYLNKLKAPFTMTPGGYMIVRNAPGSEASVFGAAMPTWKVALKKAKMGHSRLRHTK